MPLGEFTELPTNYEGTYRPARMGLRRALESGRIRNPLQMGRSEPLWSRRPASAGKVKSSSRPTSAVRSLPAAGGSLTARTAATTTSVVKEAGVKEADAPIPAAGSMPASPTAAEQKGPGILQPQRIELPGFLNTPARKPDSQMLRPEEKTQAVKRIQDLEMLTVACRRAQKVREEGRAHFSLGVLRDNLKQYRKAVESYNQFLRVCKECSDSQGCALAYHCIAIDYQLMGSAPPEPSNHTAPDGEPPAPGEQARGVKPELLKKAIMFHNKHREHSDAVGKFVAHLNMGLAYAQLGEKESATVNFQYALRYALQLHSLEGQSLAIGSLSFSAGMYENDPEKLRVLIERYVDLCGMLKQNRNQASALKALGLLAGQSGNNDQSIDYFRQAIDAAKEQGDHEAEQECSVRLGIAAGQAKMAEHLSSILQQSVVRDRG